MGRIVQIDVEDFKSYRGKQVIGPFKNFTSVIGPNGSGKSNLMDAISFVLGVRGGQIRSAHATDLIHRPTTGRTAENAPSQASVTVVYEDSNQNIVRYTRTANASGSSTYRVDGRAVTFAQYSSSLATHNILVKARNFLVFQGTVQTIASQSPQDLTNMIEEISGSGALRDEYNRLKELQEHASVASVHSFTKRRSINAELKQFKEQKEEAEKFDKLSAEVTKLVSEHLLWRLFHIDERAKAVGKAIETEKLEINEISSTIAPVENQLKEAKRMHAASSRNVLKLEKALSSQEKKLSDRKPELARLVEQIAHGNKKLATATRNYQRETENLEQERSSIVSLEKNLHSLDRTLKLYQDAARQRADAQGKAMDESDMTTYSRLKSELRTRTFSDKQELDSIQLKLKTLGDRFASESDSLLRLQVRKQNIETKRDNLSKQRATQSGELDDLEKEYASITRQIEELQMEKRRADTTRSDLQDKLRETQNKLKYASADLQENKKQQERREMMMGLKRAFSGVYGTIGNLCRPIQQRFERAMMVILAKHVDSIVVDTEATAIECIKYLRDSRLGTATFLPLDTIDVKPINEKLRQLAGVHMALDVLQFEDMFARAISFVCGNTVICDDFRIAQNITYNQYRDVKSVTLDGIIIHKNGMITGGRRDDNGDIRQWEDKDIEELKTVQLTLVHKLDELSNVLDSDVKERDLQSRASSTEARIKSINSIIFELDHDITDAEKELSMVTKDWEELTVRHSQREAEINSLRHDAETIEARIYEVQDELFSALAKKLKVANIREYELKQGKEVKEAAEKAMQFETEKMKIVSQISFLKGKLPDSESKVRALSDAIEADKESIVALQREYDSLLSENTITQEHINNVMTDLDAARKEVDERNKQADSIAKELARINSIIDDKRKHISTLESQLEQYFMDRYTIYRRCKLDNIFLPLASGSLEDVPLVEIDEIVRDDRMDIEQSQADVSQVIGHLKPDFSRLTREARSNGSTEKDNEYKNTIANIRIEIQQLAPNVKANERLVEVEGKLRETTREFERSRKESRDAKEAFAQIKKERYDKFMDAYNHIFKHIDPIYKELTKSRTVPLGGTAYLSLEDTVEPYNAGVKYHAMPPMKRFQDMGWLSGGEKTVAALALLFAIHMYHPSPFFVLDEIDAALDNTNVTKVANYISNHASDEFQFIVISLKNLFYERAQGLVGIYMDQEDRSSRILTLDLEERFTEE